MNKTTRIKRTKSEPMIIGWIEHVDLPDLRLNHIRCKIDTGARTSALHAMDIELFTRQKVEWVRFKTKTKEDKPRKTIEAPVYDKRHIKNTSGVPEERIVIRTTFKIGGKSWPISVSLSDRSTMRFPLIVGRTALKKHNIAVHTHRANLAEKIHTHKGAKT